MNLCYVLATALDRCSHRNHQRSTRVALFAREPAVMGDAGRRAGKGSNYSVSPAARATRGDRKQTGAWTVLPPAQGGIVNWLIHFIGADYGARYGTWVPENFWAGFGSDLGEIAIIGGLIAVVRKHNCEVKGCFRLGRHQTAAGHHVCRRHHPDDHLTAERVVAEHEVAKAAGG